jgi:predicted TIM-barrel fold metal-dependent hydrolase
MDAEPTSVEELERVLAIDRRGVVIWAHCGTWADAGLIRRLLAQHPNLLCELSQRDDRPRPTSEFRRRVMITDEGRQLRSEWKAVLEDYSDRFLVGTDTANPGQYQGLVDFFRAVLAQLTSETARRIAHGNALRLFRLSQ